MSSDVQLAAGPGAYDPCPCGSELKSKFCCRRGRRWKCRSVGVLLRPGDPDAAHPKCYAAAYGGCSERITREHYFTRGVLNLIGDLEVRGLPGSPVEQPRRLGIKALTAKVLCEVHNSHLSRLDVVGTHLFETFKQTGAGLPADPSFHLFNGLDVERWLLKVLLGFSASGAAPDEGRRVRLSERPDPSLLAALYEGRPLGRGHGLYFVEPPHGRLIPGKLGFNLLFERVGEREAKVVGVQADLNGFTFALLLRRPANGGRPQFNQVWYRPRQVWLRRQDETLAKVVEFTWPAASQGQVLQLIEAP